MSFNVICKISTIIGWNIFTRFISQFVIEVNLNKLRYKMHIHNYPFSKTPFKLMNVSNTLNPKELKLLEADWKKTKFERRLSLSKHKTELSRLTVVCFAFLILLTDLILFKTGVISVRYASLKLLKHYNILIFAHSFDVFVVIATTNHIKPF